MHVIAVAIARILASVTYCSLSFVVRIAADKSIYHGGLFTYRLTVT